MQFAFPQVVQKIGILLEKQRKFSIDNYNITLFISLNLYAESWFKLHNSIS